MFKKAKQIGAEDSTYTTRLRTLADSCGYPEMETEIRNHFIAAWIAQTADLVTFTKEILNGKLHFLCSVVVQVNFALGRKFGRNQIARNF